MSEKRRDDDYGVGDALSRSRDVTSSEHYRLDKNGRAVQRLGVVTEIVLVLALVTYPGGWNLAFGLVCLPAGMACALVIVAPRRLELDSSSIVLRGPLGAKQIRREDLRRVLQLDRALALLVYPGGVVLAIDRFESTSGSRVSLARLLTSETA
jgi:hypothetical protein